MVERAAEKNISVTGIIGTSDKGVRYAVKRIPRVGAAATVVGLGVAGLLDQNTPSVNAQEQGQNCFTPITLAVIERVLPQPAQPEQQRFIQDQVIDIIISGNIHREVMTGTGEVEVPLRGEADTSVEGRPARRMTLVYRRSNTTSVPLTLECIANESSVGGEPYVLLHQQGIPDRWLNSNQSRESLNQAEDNQRQLISHLNWIPNAATWQPPFSWVRDIVNMGAGWVDTAVGWGTSIVGNVGQVALRVLLIAGALPLLLRILANVIPGNTRRNMLTNLDYFLDGIPPRNPDANGNVPPGPFPPTPPGAVPPDPNLPFPGTPAHLHPFLRGVVRALAHAILGG